MKKIVDILLHIFCAGILFITCNSITLGELVKHKAFLWLCVPLFIVINILPSVSNRKLRTVKLRISADGCELLRLFLIPQKQQMVVAKTYNAALRKFGDANPDFLASVYDLTASSCKKRNEEVKDVEGIYYQSVGSKLNVASCGRFPLNFSYKLVNHFDGSNDGLVGEQSFVWGEQYQLLSVKGKRGISHGDMIDLNRENFEEFDVREFYVRLVQELKRKGL